ncbi:MAG: GIY-YIG nuclease family protein [Candidatus Blackburnbacteria bacterium]|nr:GIY-YIG nuclease family protein [Candidatus Blackburnbacteria bacterium]
MPSFISDLGKQAKSLVKGPGVYIFKNAQGNAIYVGKSINVYERVSSHLQARGTKSQDIAREAIEVATIPVFSELEALLLEAELIKKHLPKYNSAAKDDKHPLYIKISTSEEFPKVGMARREDFTNGKSAKRDRYFGPFPSSANIKSVLRQIRKVFPYCSQKKLGKRGCFYSHIGLCNPCPNNIVHDLDLAAGGEPRQGRDSRLRLTALYKSNIRKITTLLSGKTKRLEKQLLGEMKAASLREDFEAAARIRDQLRQISYITKPYEKPKAYLENPNLVSDIREEELRALQDILSAYHPSLGAIHRIECYDVAHTGGKETTCSMVTFIDGEPEKKLYRRFRIKKVKGVDDFASLSEALTRRFSHLADWGKPDLIVVDGGKGQVSAALEVLALHPRGGSVIPTIGLAKREEEIVIPLFDGGFNVVRLGQDNPATKLLQRMRDEAHRFARAYHFKLRLKELLPQSLDK